MLLAVVARGVIFAAVMMAALSCRRAGPAVATVPAGAAYRDGFQVVVFDVVGGAAVNGRAVSLKEAEQAIAAGARALIPGDPSVLQEAVAVEKPGDARVTLDVKPLDADQQRVRLELREADRTYVYEYTVDGAKIIPTGSEYRDVNGARAVRYSGE
jgi:hypothetical protein